MKQYSLYLCEIDSDKWDHPQKVYLVTDQVASPAEVLEAATKARPFPSNARFNLSLVTDSSCWEMP